MKDGTAARPASPAVTITRGMTITHDDFFRLLPRALKNRPFDMSEQGVLVTLNNGRLKITLAPQTDRTIGALTLPVTRIAFEFENCTDAERRQFFEGFDLVYQKGGG